MKDIDYLSSEVQALIQVALDSQREQLDMTTEYDVIAAMDATYVSDVLRAIAPDVLLEFFRFMVLQRLGPAES